MNARMKSVDAGLLVIVSKQACKQGKWTRVWRALGRIGLLLGSPIASFRWARAKRKAKVRKGEIPARESDRDIGVIGW